MFHRKLLQEINRTVLPVSTVHSLGIGQDVSIESQLSSLIQFVARPRPDLDGRLVRTRSIRARRAALR